MARKLGLALLAFVLGGIVVALFMKGFGPKREFADEVMEEAQTQVGVLADKASEAKEKLDEVVTELDEELSR